MAVFNRNSVFCILHSAFAEVFMSTKTKSLLIQLAGLLLCLVCALAGILYFVASQQEEEAPKQDSLQGYLDNTPENEEPEEEYDPLADIEKVILSEEDAGKSYDYFEYEKKYEKVSALKEQGYSLSSEVYSSENTRLGLYADKSFSEGFSLTDHTVNNPVVSEGKKGGYLTTYEAVSEQCPVLTPYYGYIIYRTDKVTKLLSPEGYALIEDFSGYEPAYMTDYNGNPLFKKEDKYYFYYSGKDYKGTAYSNVTNEDYSKLSTTVPTAYQYFSIDRDRLLNYFNTNNREEAQMTGIVYYLQNYSGMVEFTVDELTMIDLLSPSPVYNRSSGKLFRFPAYTYTKKEDPKVNEDDKPHYTIEVTDVKWGYMDDKGNVVIEPVYKNAYEFSEDGFAVVEDKHGHVCVINEFGSVVFNAYDINHYFPDLGNQRVRDGHYMPDTLGFENIGMLRYDNGYVRMRRKLVDTENGYIVRRELQVLVDTEGREVNIPGDCSIEGYSDGVMLIKRGEKYGYMRADGSWLIEPSLTYAEPFCEGLAVMGYADGKLGMIDTEGNICLYPMYRYISKSSGGIITAYSDEGGWSIFYKMSTVKEKELPVNPAVELKHRAIAQARYEFYVLPKEQEKAEAESKTTEAAK